MPLERVGAGAGAERGEGRRRPRGGPAGWARWSSARRAWRRRWAPRPSHSPRSSPLEAGEERRGACRATAILGDFFHVGESLPSLTTARGIAGRASADTAGAGRCATTSADTLRPPDDPPSGRRVSNGLELDRVPACRLGGSSARRWLRRWLEPERSAQLAPYRLLPPFPVVLMLALNPRAMPREAPRRPRTTPFITAPSLFPLSLRVRGEPTWQASCDPAFRHGTRRCLRSTRTASTNPQASAEPALFEPPDLSMASGARPRNGNPLHPNLPAGPSAS